MEKMSKRLKIAVAVGVVAVLAGAAIYSGYVLSVPSPCAGVSTSEAPSLSDRSETPNPHPVPSVSDALSTADTNRSSGRTVPPSAPSAGNGTVVPIVAAENVWGSLIRQLGGTHVNVTSIITDPNTDPHEYESNDSDAIAVKNAQYIIVNNVGYDDWATQLISADGDSGQTILNIGDSLGVKVTGGIVTGNPHLWYNPSYVNRTVGWMFDNLTALEPSLTSYFASQYDNMNASLAHLYSEVGLIKHLFAGTEVAATESIFVYLANATDLDLVSPPAFMEAIAESNDPPDQSVVTFECQLESGQVQVLVFNAQTVTPITKEMKEIAQAHNVSVTSVTESMVPPSTARYTDTFQAWMGGQLDSLYTALDAKKLGQ